MTSFTIHHKCLGQTIDSTVFHIAKADKELTFMTLCYNSESFTPNATSKDILIDLKNDYIKVLESSNYQNKEYVYLKLGKIFELLNDTTNAIISYSSCIERIKGNETGIISLKECARKIGDKYYLSENCYNMEGNYIDAFVGRGKFRYLKGDYIGAINDMEKAERINYNFLEEERISEVEIYFYLGMSNLIQGNDIKGCEYLSKGTKYGSEQIFELINKYCNN